MSGWQNDKSVIRKSAPVAKVATCDSCGGWPAPTVKDGKRYCWRCA